jgi:signal recognition particle subunit SEC65
MYIIVTPTMNTENKLKEYLTELKIEEKVTQDKVNNPVWHPGKSELILAMNEGKLVHIKRVIGKLEKILK